MAVTQIPKYTGVLQVDDGNTAGAIVKRDATGGIVVGLVTAQGLSNSGRIVLPVTTKTSAYTATTSDFAILCNATSAAFTVTLPAAAGVTGQVLSITKTDSSGNAVDIDGNGTETINGSATVSLSSQWATRLIQSDGANWFVVAS